VNGAGVSTATNTVTATTTTAPAPTWAFRDIGAVGVAGSNNSIGNTIAISGSGSDIWDRADAFRFVYRAWTGDGVVEAHITSMDNTSEWAKAGVMIRETLDANAKNAFLCLTPSSHGALAQSRQSAGEITNQTQGPFANAPYWVRLVRTGNDFHRYFSADGVNWIDHGYYVIPMATTVYFGFAVTSHDNARLNTAVFSDPFVGTR
jgi:regulation of enolase protein 1 (concanavalin A-like superfamily)